MARLIDADKLKAHYAWWADAGNADMRDAFDTIVDLQPTVDPVKHGRWADTTETVGWPKWSCSVCGGDGRGDYEFCPWCGARMDLIGEDKSHPFAESVMMGMDGGEE